jgi:DNA-directed RNA polymerase II subunit RPB3
MNLEISLDGGLPTSKLTFKMNDLTVANALRKIMIRDVPTLAIDEVWLDINTSAFPDEILCHRIGLIVLNSTSLYSEDEKDLSETFSLDLDVECKEEEMIVRSSMFVCSHESVAPVDPNLYIIRLTKGQRIKMHTTAIPGTGKTHNKWSPTIISHYNIDNEGDKDDEMTVEMEIEPIGHIPTSLIFNTSLNILQQTLNNIIIE